MLTTQKNTAIKLNGGYRYGFNGMEGDDEVKGDGNSYTTEFRQYDPRVGRWLSLDALMELFPHQSGYCAFNNNPIFFKDPTGLEGEDPINSDPIKTTVENRYMAFPANPQKGDVVTLEYTDENVYYDQQKFEYSDELDQWMIKESRKADTKVWEDHSNINFGIAARHETIGQTTQDQIGDVTLGTDIGSTLVGTAADETITETIKDTKHLTSGTKTLTKILKFTKGLGVIATGVDVVVNTVDAVDNFKDGNIKEGFKSTGKAVGGIGIYFGAAYVGALVGGPVGAVVAVAVTVAWSLLTSWW